MKIEIERIGEKEMEVRKGEKPNKEQKIIDKRENMAFKF